MSDGIEKDGASRRLHMPNVAFYDAILEVGIDTKKVFSLTEWYACFAEAVVYEAYIVSTMMADSYPMCCWHELNSDLGLESFF